MTKFIDSLGLKRLVTKIGEAVGNGTWLPVKKGDGEGAVVEGEDTTASGLYSHAQGFSSTASGPYSHAEGSNTYAEGKGSHAEGTGAEGTGDYSHAEGSNTTAEGMGSHAEGSATTASGTYSHAEGDTSTAKGMGSHAEGYNIEVTGKCSHAQGFYNYNNSSFIDIVGVGGVSDDELIRKNASVIYVKRDTSSDIDPSDPKNGYQYLIGVGGYQGQDIAEGMKSVQEVIADLEKGVAASETMTVEEIREIMSA